MKAPLTMPASGVAMQQFEPQRIDYAAPEAGGRLGGVQAGFPLWLAVWTIGVIGARKSDEMRGFVTQLRGQMRRFHGRDLARPYPLAYVTAGFTGMTRAGGGSFDGSALTWAETITADDDSQLDLTGLPADFELAIGDYAGFKWTSTDPTTAGLEWRALVRVVEAATADGSGNISVLCEPAVPTCVPEGATLHFDNPSCIMALVTDQSKLDAIDRRLAVKGGTIVGLQDLRD